MIITINIYRPGFVSLAPMLDAQISTFFLVSKLHYVCMCLWYVVPISVFYYLQYCHSLVILQLIFVI